MITIEQTQNLVNVAVLGEFTIADFKTFEEQSLYKLKTPRHDKPAVRPARHDQLHH